MLLVRKGPTSHLPLHDDDNDNDTIEIPPTEIFDRIFIARSFTVNEAPGTRTPIIPGDLHPFFAGPKIKILSRISVSGIFLVSVCSL